MFRAYLYDENEMKTTPDSDNDGHPKLFCFCGPPGKFSPYGLFPTVIGPMASDLSLLKETLQSSNYQVPRP